MLIRAARGQNLRWKTPRNHGGRRRVRAVVLAALALFAGVLSAPPVLADPGSGTPAPVYLAPKVDSSISVESVSSAQRYNSATATISRPDPAIYCLPSSEATAPSAAGSPRWSPAVG